MNTVDDMKQKKPVQIIAINEYRILESELKMNSINLTKIPN